MIVSEDQVETALEYLGIDPHPLSLAWKDLTDAENEKDRVYAEIYKKQEGSIKDREMACERSEEVVRSRMAISMSKCALERARARIKWAEMIIEIFRTEAATARIAERIR